MERIEAHGGSRGGAGTPTGEQVVVTFDGAVVEVFAETGSHRFHVRLVDAFGLVASPAPTGETLQVTAARQGIAIPVRFDGAQRDALDRIVAAVEAARG